jgi:Myelodysplasia-myeloid leukemia factor 1-interacting protein
MSYPLQPYNPNNGALVDQQYNRGTLDGNIGGGDLLGSLYGLANQLMSEILRSGPSIGGISSFMGIDPNNPHVKVIGISSMNVTQISRGPDGRPHIIQAHDERRMGPSGIWQTRKALHDPDRGIDKMQIGYFIGDRGEIIERRLDPSTGQYRQEIQRHAMAPNEPNFSHHWRMQPQQIMQRQPALPPPPPRQYQHYPQQQQQLPSYAQQSQQALPAPSSYQYS